MPSIAIDGGRDRFEPGEPIRGRVEWTLEEAPSALEIRLLWYTEGRGDRDVGVARTLREEGLSSLGTRSFDFEAPAGPCSCSGRLISIRWAIEASFLPGRQTERIEIVLGPGGQEIEIGRPAA
jgi:hypothetical protein